MTRIIVVRHGQTAWNEGEGERFRGRADIELDEKGIRQAEATAKRIAREGVNAIYSSPLKRTMSTAKALSEPPGLPVQPIEGLIDIDFGKWQGLSLKEAADDDPKLYDLWLQSPHLVTFPGGENLGQVQQRVVSALETLIPGHREQTIVLVSHKVVCKVLLCHLIGLGTSGYWKVEQDTCAVNIAEAEDDIIKVALLNDTCHLKGLE